MPREPIKHEATAIKVIQLDSENAGHWASEQTEDTDLELLYNRHLCGTHKTHLLKM